MQASAETRIDTRQPGQLASQIEPFNAGPISIEPMRSGGFQAKARAWSLGDVALFQVTMRQGRVFSPPLRSVRLSIPLDGRIAVVGGADEATFGPGTCFARDDTDVLDVEVPGSVVFVASIDERLLCETAGKLAGADPPERFRAEPILSLTTPTGSRLWRGLMSIWRDLRCGASWLQTAPAMAEARSGLAEALIDVTLRTGPDRVPDCGHAPLRRGDTEQARAVLESYLEDGRNHPSKLQQVAEVYEKEGAYRGVRPRPPGRRHLSRGPLRGRGGLCAQPLARVRAPSRCRPREVRQAASPRSGATAVARG